MAQSASVVNAVIYIAGDLPLLLNNDSHE